jgi:hypothetical protein
VSQEFKSTAGNVAVAKTLQLDVFLMASKGAAALQSAVMMSF